MVSFMQFLGVFRVLCCQESAPVGPDFTFLSNQERQAYETVTGQG